ncbi:hypothetical protein CPB83DRAFT_852312 [Crepidotus variabilis]|uniref:JmjC domain-containing protein n=1 Tax=Crepidotus variabilis TaxID=179855 RepID=A0A9P6EI90_9AGAR|nr:hypothetical protein CPB83DRAFT_852312 [Crepidotus variabilis]
MPAHDIISLALTAFLDPPGNSPPVPISTNHTDATDFSRRDVLQLLLPNKAPHGSDGSTSAREPSPHRTPPTMRIPDNVLMGMAEGQGPSKPMDLDVKDPPPPPPVQPWIAANSTSQSNELNEGSRSSGTSSESEDVEVEDMRPPPSNTLKRPGENIRITLPRVKGTQLGPGHPTTRRSSRLGEGLLDIAMTAGEGRALRSSTKTTGIANSNAGPSLHTGTTKRSAKKRKRALTVNETVGSEGRDAFQILSKRIHLDLQAGNTPDDPICIDVDQYSLFNFAGEKLEHLQSDLQPICPPRQSKRVTTTRPLQVWDAALTHHNFLPRFHHEEELIKFVHLMESVSNSYINDLPKHVASPKESCFHILEYSDYSRLKDSDVLSLLRDKCIVVRNMDWPEMKFDREGLATLSPLDAIISIQDLTLPLPKDGSDRIQNGTLAQMLEASERDGSGKALNALSFPFANADSERSCFDRAPQASCRIAWKNTSGTVYPREAAMPLSDVHWGLAATGGAMSLWHIDSDGLGTTIDVRVGEKLWIVGSDEEDKFNRLGLLLSDTFDLDVPPQSFATKAILLTANTRLIMRPNVVHAVFTPKNTICHGSHFYTTSTMQATLASLIHGFVCHSYITNISHPKTRVFLRRLCHLYHRGLVLRLPMTDAEKSHLPALNAASGASANIDEVVNFLSVIALSIFANALDPRTYMASGQGKDAELTEQQYLIMDRYDVNAIPEEERKEISTCRGAGLDALAWFRRTYQVTTIDNNVRLDLPSIFFVHIARSLLRYKYAAEVNSISAAGGCLSHQLLIQIESALHLDPQLWALWSSYGKDGWLDDELRDIRKVEVQEGLLSTGSANFGEEGEVADICMGSEEGEIEEESDRRVEVPKYSVQTVQESTPTNWRQEVLGLPDKTKYVVNRTPYQHAHGDFDYTSCQRAGETSLDWAYATGALLRKASEALGIKDHLSELEQSGP